MHRQQLGIGTLPCKNVLHTGIQNIIKNIAADTEYVKMKLRKSLQCIRKSWLIGRIVSFSFVQLQKLCVLFSMMLLKVLDEVCFVIFCKTLEEKGILCCYSRRPKLIASIDLFSSCSVPTACLATI